MNDDTRIIFLLGIVLYAIETWYLWFSIYYLANIRHGVVAVVPLINSRAWQEWAIGFQVSLAMAWV